MGERHLSPWTVPTSTPNITGRSPRSGRSPVIEAGPKDPSQRDPDPDRDRDRDRDHEHEHEHEHERGGAPSGGIRQGAPTEHVLALALVDRLPQPALVLNPVSKKSEPSEASPRNLLAAAAD